MAHALKPTKTLDVKIQNVLYNMVLVHPAKHSDVDTESWTNKGSKKEMLDFCSPWDPIIKDLLSYVPLIKSWKGL